MFHYPNDALHTVFFITKPVNIQHMQPKSGKCTIEFKKALEDLYVQEFKKQLYSSFTKVLRAVRVNLPLSTFTYSGKFA